MKLAITWKPNSLAFGQDDPHHKTEHEAHHAKLSITHNDTRIELAVPEGQYSKEVVEILRELARSYNELKKKESSNE